MPIDLEKENDNSARVKEHPAIYSRRSREAADYRKTPAAQLDIVYGSSPLQSIDLFPVKDENAPLALFIHGGWWRSLSPKSFSQMAKGPNANGIAVAVVGYD